MPTIGLVANVYNEANALPGWLEVHTPFFDDVRVLHAGPQGAYSTDGTIEILEKWRIPVEFCTIDAGFGQVRTRAIHMSPCDYVILLDADERFYPVHRILHCRGQSTHPQEVDWILQSYDYRGVNLPNWENIGRLGANLCVDIGESYDQGARLREIISNGKYDAVVTYRRHWHDLSLRRPTQDWIIHPDWQMRTVRNHSDIRYSPETRMHEQLVGYDPGRVFQPDPSRGPFFDHFHFHFKRMEPEQRRHDIAIYDAIHEGRQPPVG